MGRRIGYINGVNNLKDDSEFQVIGSARCDILYFGNSHRSTPDANLLQCLDSMSKNDTLVCAKISSVSPPLSRLLLIAERLAAVSCTLELVTEGTTFNDRHLAVIARVLNTCLTVESQHTEFANRKRKKGRPSKLTRDKCLRAVQLLNTHTSKEVAGIFGVTRDGLYKALRRERLIEFDNNENH